MSNVAHMMGLMQYNGHCIVSAPKTFLKRNAISSRPKPTTGKLNQFFDRRDTSHCLPLFQNHEIMKQMIVQGKPGCTAKQRAHGSAAIKPPISRMISLHILANFAEEVRRLIASHSCYSGISTRTTRLSRTRTLAQRVGGLGAP
jgi:hypothetical protein